MNPDLGTENISKLLWQLSVPAILGMLSSAIFNLADRIFVGKISSYALTAVGITMPVQILQMAFVLLIGIGSSSLIAIKLGEGKKEEAEDILYLVLKYSVVFLAVFAAVFLVFLNPIMNLLAISSNVLPYAKRYIVIIIAGSITGIPGYCLNNSLRSIGQANTSMKIIVATSILNILLDPLFIYGFRLGITGAAIATVISQTVLTVYVIYAFVKREDFMIHLKKRKVKRESKLVLACARMGTPPFLVQLLATLVNIFVNKSFLKYGTELDIAAVTIISSVFSFYHMAVNGIVQGNNAICGFNWGAKKYKRVRKALNLASIYAFGLSFILFLIIELFPHVIVDIFTDEQELAAITVKGMRLYLCMIPFVGVQSIIAQYFQAVGYAKRSSILSFLRYGSILVPSVLLLAPKLGVRGIYLGNAFSDGLASLIAFFFIYFEIRRLKTLENERTVIEGKG